ncbi:MAG: DUF3857 domain-containing protein [Cyclobacteriaceae bacterium]
MKKIILLAIMIWASNSLIAQKSPFKFGKVSEVELAMESYPYDEEASAAILGDFGESKFIYNKDKGFQIEFEREVRVKIFDKNGYDQADVSINYYDAGGYGKEEISLIKGFSYNLVNGKVVKEKLSKDAVFQEQLSENWFRTKFTLPNVKEGTVIEYSYKITSDYFQNLREWEFQKDIPVLISEYRVTIPEYYDYQLIAQGNHPFTVRDNKPLTEKFEYEYTSVPGKVLSARTAELESNSKYYRWVVENVPAIKTETYMTTVSDYSTKIGFQLVGRKYPGQPYDNLAITYGSFNRTMWEREAYGKRLERLDFLQADIAGLKKEDPSKTAVAIYEHIRTTINWNDQYGVFPQQNLQKTYKDEQGSVADINMLLVASFRAGGLNAYPVIVSTRSNGKPHPQYPSLERFNYTVASVEIDGNVLLADASAKIYPFGTLPERCLNGRGWQVNDKGGQWVELQNNAVNESLYRISLILGDDGLVTSDVQIENKGYQAIETRRSFLKDGEEEYFSEIASSIAPWTMASNEVENDDNIYGSLIEKYTLESGVESAGLIYLNPFVAGVIGENPFRSETRSFPIDMETRLKRQHMIEIEIPDGYMVEELPESIVLRLPNKAGSFQYRSSSFGNKISIVSSVSIEKLYHLPGDYPGLKQFFDRVIAKQAEQIVLKKNT